MVYLSRIYTRTGDQGETSLGDGTRVAKDDPRVAAMGTVDELNGLLGLMLAQCPDLTEAGLVRRIQNELFDLGADLCVPWTAMEQPGERLRIQSDRITSLEQAIDRLNSSLEPLRSFVLPGGSIASGWCHLARAVCRQAERETVTLGRGGKVNPQVIVYLNRLSDLLFVLARRLNQDAAGDVLWQPGGGPGAS